MKLADFGGPGPRTPHSRHGVGLAEAASGRAEPIRSRAQVAESSIYNTSQGRDSGGNQGGQQQPTQGGQPTDPNAAAAPPPQYDLSADPVLQQVQAAVTLGNQQAQSAELNSQEQALLQYGDPALAAKILGANDPMVQAAGQNQESTLALLKRGYNQGLQNYDNNLDPSLLFSGARIHGEGQIGQAYQDDLARAAAAIQGQLGGIGDTYTQQVQANEDKLLQALSDAYTRALQNALTNPPASGGSGSSGSSKPKGGHKKSRLAAAAGTRPDMAGGRHNPGGGMF